MKRIWATLTFVAIAAFAIEWAYRSELIAHWGSQVKPMKNERGEIVPTKVRTSMTDGFAEWGILVSITLVGGLTFAALWNRENKKASSAAKRDD